MKKYKMPIWQEFLIVTIFFVVVPGFLVTGVNKITIANLTFWLFALFVIKAREYNYLVLTDEEIQVRNYIYPWLEKPTFQIKDIEYIDFGKPMGIASCAYIKILNKDKFSKRHNIRLVSHKQVKSFAKRIEKQGVLVNKEYLNS